MENLPERFIPVQKKFFDFLHPMWYTPLCTNSECSFYQKEAFYEASLYNCSLRLSVCGGCGLPVNPMGASKKRGALLWVLMSLALLCSACSTPRQGKEPKSAVYYTYFDTVSCIYSYAEDSENRFADNTAIAAGVLEDYHRLFDIYHEYAGINNLCTVNRLAGGAPVAVDQRLIDFLRYAQQMYEITGGEMNIMMGSVLKLWHESYVRAMDDPDMASIPDPRAIAAASVFTDPALLEVDEEACTVRITDHNASIDVGALGKGYATEQAALALQDAGVTGYVLNIGGNIRILGSKPDGSGWRTGVRNPSDPDGAYARYLDLHDISCVTSGNYERYFTVDGVRYHHIIDSDTHYPADYFSSVTVLSADSAMADALSTALFCMPYEDGLALAESLDGVQVLWILPDGRQLSTKGMEAVTVSP